MLDWHQVLDRSREESAWITERIPAANVRFLQRVRERFGDGVLVCVCSHIEKSSEKLERLLRAVNKTPEVLRVSLICFITITVNRCGPFGKLQTTSWDNSPQGRSLKDIWSHQQSLTTTSK